jgi:hypothetical protein
MINHNNRYKRLLAKIQNGKCETCGEEIGALGSELKPRATPREGNIVFLKHATLVHKECVNG